MKVKIEYGEWYPVYRLGEDDYYVYEDDVVEGEIDNATLEKWNRVFREFREVQIEMRAATKGMAHVGLPADDAGQEGA